MLQNLIIYLFSTVFLMYLLMLFHCNLSPFSIVQIVTRVTLLWNFKEDI